MLTLASHALKTSEKSGFKTSVLDFYLAVIRIKGWSPTIQLKSYDFLGASWNQADLMLSRLAKDAWPSWPE